MFFKDCTLEQLDKTFSLRPLRQISALEDWLKQSKKISILKREREYLLMLQSYLQDNVFNWNETELAMHFIGPMFALVQFSYDHKFNLFAERLFSGMVDGIEMSGRPDGMIATGYREPDKPYFCFQEYKRETDPNGDPAGQALAAMLTAQESNEHQFPLYGCYVRGRQWFFIALQNKEYAISEEYTATKEDIFDILRVLKMLKQMMIERVNQ